MTAYLDHAASSPLRPEVKAAVIEAMAIANANPLSTHTAGRAARTLLEEARERIGAAFGVSGVGVVLCSGATESANIGIIGAAVAMRTSSGKPVVAACSSTEHAAVLGPIRHIGESGLGTSEVLAVNEGGMADPSVLARAAAGSQALVSVMAVNNETGIRNDVSAVAEAVRDVAIEAVIHVDAVQGFAYDDHFDQWLTDVDLISIAGHKLGGPRGIGALIVRSPHLLEPITFGGSSETAFRPGTPDLPGAVGLALAVEMAASQREVEIKRLAGLRASLLASITAAIPGAAVTAANADLAPHLLHLTIPGLRSEELLLLLDGEGLAASAGSACASGAGEASRVLAAMGMENERAKGALRLSLGWSTTEAEVAEAGATVVKVLRRLGA